MRRRTISDTELNLVSELDVFNTEAHPFKAPKAKDTYGSRAEAEAPTLLTFNEVELPY